MTYPFRFASGHPAARAVIIFVIDFLRFVVFLFLVVVFFNIDTKNATKHKLTIYRHPAFAAVRNAIEELVAASATKHVVPATFFRNVRILHCAGT